MAITMTAKHQITIPKRIADALGLRKGVLFDITVSRDKIELTPLETIERVFTEEEYKKMDLLSREEKGKEMRPTKKFINNLKKGRV